MMFIGVDPGLTGACAVIDHRGVRAVFDIPTMEDPSAGPKALVKRKVDGRAMCSLILKHCPASEGKPTVIIEKVGTMGGQNNAVQTQGSLLRTLGALESVFECLAMPLHYAAPQTWKRSFAIKADKDRSLELARALYPGAAADLKLKKHHNRAEAVLLAHWGIKELS